VQKISLEALQEIRLNTAGKPLIRKMKHRKAKVKRFKPILLTNDDTAKQLFARSH
jgi:hypothetical protein